MPGSTVAAPKREPHPPCPDFDSFFFFPPRPHTTVETVRVLAAACGGSPLGSSEKLKDKTVCGGLASAAERGALRARPCKSQEEQTWLVVCKRHPILSSLCRLLGRKRTIIPLACEALLCICPADVSICVIVGYLRAPTQNVLRDACVPVHT